ncbi:universal stress protein [Acidovorax carolinensis]|uniref:Universal stress protein n=1 Tax=Acidovorax carolinensis TaxID=553814 RepID=A0A240U1X1_9BURK|nr:universal stress protein [Acidovorax carolinensis]ART51855.1 universal stress protein [Acidovorax carolinensis]
MVPLHRLVAATDLSAPARHAVERAASVALATGAQLDVVHVATPAPIERLRRLAGQIPSDLEKLMLEAPRNAMQELASALAQRHGVTAQVHVASGSLLTELRQHTETINADLVVLGARGASFMRHMLLGSTADRMVSRATRPMLVVKQAPHEPYKTVLVPVDFSERSLRSIRLAQAVAPRAALILLHAYDVPFEGMMEYAGVHADEIQRYRASARQEAQQSMVALCEAAGLNPALTPTLVMHGDPSLLLVQQEQELDCDLLVMGKQGDNAVEDMLLGSVTRYALAQSQCDVLIAV